MNFNESRLSLGMGRLSMSSVGSVGNYQAIDGMRLVQRPSFGAVRDYEGVVMSKQPPPQPQQRNYSDYEILQRMRNSSSSRPQHRDYDAVNFNSRKDYEALTFRPSVPPQIAPKPRLSSVDEVPSSSSDQPKRPPPPLPPKPIR